MQIKYRLQESTDSKRNPHDGNTYQHCFMQIIDKSYPNQKRSTSISPIIEIKWLSYLEKEESSNGKWFAIEFTISGCACSVENFAKLHKLVKFLNDKGSTSIENIQPQDIIDICNGIEYFPYCGDWIPTAWKTEGYNHWKVNRIRTSGEKDYYYRIYAKTEGEAQKELSKLLKNNGHTITENFEMIYVGIVE